MNGNVTDMHGLVRHGYGTESQGRALFRKGNVEMSTVLEQTSSEGEAP